jgi:hypothetical protein
MTHYNANISRAKKVINDIPSSLNNEIKYIIEKLQNSPTQFDIDIVLSKLNKCKQLTEKLIKIKK